MKLRRTATVAASSAALLIATVVLAGPASAGVPEGWGEDGSGVDVPLMLWLLIGFPVIATIVISVLTLLPGVKRGEGLIPKAPAALPATGDTPELESR